MSDFKQDITETQERTEGLIVEFERRKEDFSKAYESAKFNETIEIAKSLKAYLDQIISIFYLHHKRKESERKTDFRCDQRLHKLVVRMRNIVGQVEEDISTLNIGNFVRHIDQANIQVYRLLERCDHIYETGINKTHSENVRTKTTSIIREDFANWESWVTRQKRKDDDHFDELDSPKNDHLTGILKMLSKTAK